MKKWFEPLATAWVGIATHKLRSALTMLGIVIGVAAVISLMSIGKGAQADILSRIGSLGSNLITIQPGVRVGFGGFRGATGSAQTLTLEDAAAVSEQVSNIDLVSPTYSSNLQLIVGEENTNSQVTGVLPEYQEIQNLEIASGTFFSDYDYQRGAKVVVLGSSVKETLFGDTDPIGQRIRMGANIVHVIGVLESKGGTFGSPDDAILVPLTAMQQMVAQPRTAQGERVVSSIVLTVFDEEETESVTAEITELLRTRHRLGSNVDDDFSVISMQEISEAVSEATNTMTLFLGAIAAISLLVGGIGVMNIMLVSVLERTREIGIRKALGAKERDIWSQFLLEAIFLTFSGGIVGITIGWLISMLV
jgi:putative ABC transport system permease protein